MKAATHLIASLAAATCLPGVVDLASRDRGLLMLMAGVCGLLPDWLDQHVARHFEPADDVLDGGQVSPQFMAEALAEAARQAWEEAESCSVRWRPARADWPGCRIRLDWEDQQVIVCEAGQADEVPEGRAPLPYMPGPPAAEELWVGAQGGSLEFRREAGTMRLVRVPWRRRWSHSLVLAAVLGLAGGALLGGLAGWAIAVAYGAHCLLDQCDEMGANLGWPFTAQRGSGLGLGKHAEWGFGIALAAGGLLLHNLSRHTPGGYLDPGRLLLWTCLAPAAGALLHAARQVRAPE